GMTLKKRPISSDREAALALSPMPARSLRHRRRAHLGRRWKRCRPFLRPPGDRAGDGGGDHAVAMLGQRFARTELGQRHRWVERYLHADGAEPEHGPKMGREFHIAIPGEERAIEPSERDAVKPDISDRDRLHRERAMAAAVVGYAEERAFERQHAVAVAGRSFGKEDEMVVAVEPVADAIALLGRAADAPVDEHRALQLGEPAE